MSTNIVYMLNRLKLGLLRQVRRTHVGLHPSSPRSPPRRHRKFHRYYSLDDLFAAIPCKIECEDPVEVCWTSQHFGMAQRTYGVVITGLPMILHRDARKLVIFRMALVVFCPINQVHDAIDLVTSGLVQDLRFLVVAQVVREFR